MRDDERRALSGVKNEYAHLQDLLAAQPNPDGETVRNLEATDLARLHARFEGLLRRRLSLLDDDESTLVDCVQKLSGEDVGYDPANDGRSLAWGGSFGAIATSWPTAEAAPPRSAIRRR